MTNLKEIREDEEAREQHRSDWIKAEYETIGWKKEQEITDVSTEPLIGDK